MSIVYEDSMFFFLKKKLVLIVMFIENFEFDLYVVAN